MNRLIINEATIFASFKFGFCSRTILIPKSPTCLFYILYSIIRLSTILFIFIPIIYLKNCLVYYLYFINCNTDFEKSLIIFHVSNLLLILLYESEYLKYFIQLFISYSY